MSTDTEILSEDQLRKFMEEKINFPNWKPVLAESKIRFLHQIITHYTTSLYYENITWGAMDPQDRRSPSIPDIISQMMESNGGACMQLNYFLKMILEKLGFNVYAAAGHATSFPIPKNHIFVVVRIPREDLNNQEVLINRNQVLEDLYLVDVGFGRPITEPINLSKLPHRYEAGGFTAETRFNADTQLYERVLFGGCGVKGRFEAESESQVEVTYDITPRNFSDFYEPHKIIFTDASRTFLLRLLFLFRIISVNDNDVEFVCFRGKVFVHGSAKEREEVTYESYTEMIPEIWKWFPHMEADKLIKAFANYDARPPRQV